MPAGINRFVNLLGDDISKMNLKIQVAFFLNLITIRL